MGLGAKDRAFDVLQKAAANHRIRPLFLRNGQLSGIRSDPGWAELLGRMGLPP
jgi:hypothetical protein